MTAYPMQWYVLDSTAPKDIETPWAPIDAACETISMHGLICTRLPGHTGRHCATGSPADDGNCPVYEVWL